MVLLAVLLLGSSINRSTIFSIFFFIANFPSSVNYVGERFKLLTDLFFCRRGTCPRVLKLGERERKNSILITSIHPAINDILIEKSWQPLKRAE